MIRRHRNSIVFFLCFQAMAVAIICFGSLINFHQYKIWGKPLIPNFIGYKRDIEKYSKALSFSKQGHEKQNLPCNFQGGDCELPYAFLHIGCESGCWVSLSLSSIVPANHRGSSCGLRGPPIS